MNTTISLTGGARLDLFNATWPFAKLTANHELLEVKVVWAGTFKFQPDQIVGIEKYVLIPFIGWGIRIRHSVPEYPYKFIFWYLGSPSTVLAQIRASGFPMKNDNLA